MWRWFPSAHFQLRVSRCQAALWFLSFSFSLHFSLSYSFSFSQLSSSSCPVWELVSSVYWSCRSSGAPHWSRREAPHWVSSSSAPPLTTASASRLTRPAGRHRLAGATSPCKEARRVTVTGGSKGGRGGNGGQGRPGETWESQG